jgi:16S rRNA (adenine1518-N6/adenine1519-N6)-dimethyltransferase
LRQEAETREPIAEASSFFRARDVAQQIGFKPRKQFGQNFVINPNTIDRIIRLAGVTKEDVVLEVGPGLGALTQALISAARAVLAVELDVQLAGRLPQVLTDLAPWRVLNQDALRMQTKDFQFTIEPGSVVQPNLVVANLPYNIATPLVLHLFEVLPELERMLVMVQSEVAERWCAPAGGKTYGVPTVKLDWFATCKVIGQVDRSVFWPKPHVDSSLVELIKKPPPNLKVSPERVFRLIDAAFSQRRKTLANSLTSRGYPREAVLSSLKAMGLSEKVRGERLTCSQYVALSESLATATK